jgi:hypothetical protein
MIILAERTQNDQSFQTKHGPGFSLFPHRDGQLAPLRRQGKLDDTHFPEEWAEHGRRADEW